MCRTAILKNDSTAEKRREKEAFALKSIAHYCFVEIKSNCGSEPLEAILRGAFGMARLYYNSDPIRRRIGADL